MNPEQIAALLASGDKEQVKQAQKQLQALGYNIGAKGPDGSLGNDTSNAMREYRTDYANNKKNESTTAVANQQANDPKNKAINMGIESIPYLTGIGAGTAIGHGFGKKYSALDTAQGKSASAIANATDVNPQIKQEQLNRMNFRRNLRNTAQFGVPAVLGLGGYATRNLIAPQFSDPKLQDLVKEVGTGENSAAFATALHQALSTLGRGNPISDVDEARIRSGALPPSPSGPNAPPAALSPPEGEPIQHSERLKLAASVSGASPASKKADNIAAIKKNLTADNMADVAKSLKLPADATRPQILQRLREIGGVGGKFALPLAAGALAYEASGSPAKAETESGTPESPSLTSRLLAGLTAAGTAVGADKLIQAAPAIGRVAGKVLGPELALATGTPAAAEAIGIPSFQQAMADKTGISQVPERRQGPPPPSLMRAAALEVPSDIPAGTTEQANIDSGMRPEQPAAATAFPAPIQGRIQRMMALGASPQQIALFLNQAVR